MKIAGGTPALPALTFLMLFSAAIAATAPVSVKKDTKPAGSIRGEVLIKVTGDPATPDFLAPLVAKEIGRAFKLEPGARYEIGATPESVVREGVKRGASKVYSFPARLFGSGFEEVKGKADVRISNLALEDISKGGKFFASNSPEEIHRAGALLEGRLDPFAPVRIFVHHINESENDLRFACVLHNRSAAAALIHLVEGPVSISKGEIKAGHFAAVNFFRNLVYGRGTFITIPPKGSYALLKKEFQAGMIISYIVELTTLSSASVEFSIRTLYPYQSDEAYLGRHAPTKLNRPHGEFPRLDIATRGKHSIGERWLYVPVGNRPVDGTDIKDKLHGNFGLLHEIDVTVSNSTSKTGKLMIYLRPSAGPVSASFVIDGEFMEVPFAKASEMKFLKAISINPGEERDVRVLTMPEPGSYYPIHLIFGSN